VLLLKSSFLRSLLDRAVAYVPNFSSSNPVDLFNFLDFGHQ
jgi:predicted LPLAT superfamily acyltransferase